MGVEGVAEICCATKEAALRRKMFFVVQRGGMRWSVYIDQCGLRDAESEKWYNSY